MFETTSAHLINGGTLKVIPAARLDSVRRGADAPLVGDCQSPPHRAGLLRSTGDARLLSAVAYIHQHLEDPIGVQELVNHVGVSRRWLEYAFRDALGETPYQYIRRQRLEHAGRLLEEEPNSRIYQIALRTGFNSAKQLTMAFRQHFGLSPRDYRRKQCG